MPLLLTPFSNSEGFLCQGTNNWWWTFLPLSHFLAPCCSLGFPLNIFSWYLCAFRKIPSDWKRWPVQFVMTRWQQPWELWGQEPGSGCQVCHPIMMCLSTVHSALTSKSPMMLHIKQLMLGQALWIIKRTASLWFRENQMFHLPPDIITHHSHYLKFSVLAISPGNKAIFILWNANVIFQKPNIHLSVFINTLHQILFYY